MKNFSYSLNPKYFRFNGPYFVQVYGITNKILNSFITNERICKYEFSLECTIPFYIGKPGYTQDS
jgi:hypothetical protein